MAARHSRVLHRSLREQPPKAVGGDGVWLIAEDGRRILDGSGGAAVSCLGHQHPRVIEAIVERALQALQQFLDLFLVDNQRRADGDGVAHVADDHAMVRGAGLHVGAHAEL